MEQIIVKSLRQRRPEKNEYRKIITVKDKMPDI